MDKVDSVIPQALLIPADLFGRIQKNVPIVCVDLVIIRQKPAGIEVLLIKRKLVIGFGKWCLIGGRVLKGETLAQAVGRQARRELGISVAFVPPWHANSPVWVSDEPDADPQKHSICMVYLVVIDSGVPAASGPEFSESRWFKIEELPENIGFNHRHEIEVTLKALARIMDKHYGQFLKHEG